MLSKEEESFDFSLYERGEDFSEKGIKGEK